jgi:hypothetical protein
MKKSLKYMRNIAELAYIQCKSKRKRVLKKMGMKRKFQKTKENDLTQRNHLEPLKFAEIM